MNKESKPYIIGETAYNHQGDFDYLLRMVDDISHLKLNAVKFHLMLDLSSYMTNNHNIFDECKKWLFNRQQWSRIIDYSQRQKLDVVALCDDVASLKYMNTKHADIFAVELHAISLNDFFMLQEAARFQHTVILGVGGSTLDEIEYALDVLRSNGKKNIMLMYGFQSYPTDYTKINISKMLRLKSLFGFPVGYADHSYFDDSNNEFASVLAAANGISILEKHYTPDEGCQRIDFQSAVGKEKMETIRKLMKVALDVYGDGSIEMSKAEHIYGLIGPMKKAIVAKRDIKKGHKFSLNDLWFKRTADISCVKQNQLSSFIGLEAKKNIGKDEIITWDKVKGWEKTTCLSDHKNMFRGK